MTSRFALCALLVALAIAAPARAAPMSTSFSTIRTQAVVIVLGTVKVDPQGITVDVDKVVRGGHVGRMTVNQSPDGHVTVNNERVVAFIDGSNALRWVGRLAAGPSLETGVIRLQGFFDFNAHLVTPGVMTMSQLQIALQTNALIQTFDATLAFPDGHGGLRSVPSKHFSVLYDPFASTIASVQGLVLPCLGNPSLFGPSWGNFELSWSDTCLTNSSNPQRARSLELDGEFTGVTSAGAIAVQVVPTRPFMSEVEYDAFVRDRDLTDMAGIVRITPATGAAWTWRLETELVDPSGKAHPALGVSGTPAGDTYDFEGVSLTIAPAPNLGSPGGNARGMIQLIESGTLRSCSLTRRGQTAVTCTLVHAPSVWIHR